MEEKEEIMEKENNKALVIVYFIFLLVLCCVGAWYLGGRFANFTDKSTNNETKPNNGLVQVLPINDSIKEKITKFVMAGSDYRETLDQFKNGTTAISKELKYGITFNALNNDKKINYLDINNTLKVNKEDIDNYHDGFEEYNQMGANATAKISDFVEMYNYLFNEKVDFEPVNQGFTYCPIPAYYSKKNDAIYMYNQCGGDYVPWYTDIITITSDGSYYYAYTINVRALIGNEYVQERYGLVWKFDKDLNFVSTERKELTNK